MQFLNQSQSDIYLYFPATLCPLTLFSYVWGIKQVSERGEHKSYLGVGNKWFSYYWHTRSESNPIYSFLALLVPLHEHWKTLPHIPKPQTTSFSLGLKPAFPLINFQTHPTWWAVIDICIKFESPVVFAQLQLMGNLFLHHPQKTKK